MLDCPAARALRYSPHIEELILNRCRTITPILALGLTLALIRIAGADDLDPPARVARLGWLEGSAALQPAGSSAWLDDVLNRPLSTGDKLMCDSASRAELHVGSTAIRVGEQTSLQILNVSDQVLQLGLSSGMLNIRVRNLPPDQTVELDTPNVAVTVLAPGEYRIEVSPAGDVVDVAVISGYAEVTGQSQDFTLNAQQQGEFSGAETLAVNFGDVVPADAFDEWAASRDAREDNLLSANYVSPDVTGIEDLDENGTWQEVPEYGPVWIPQVSVGWVPYRVGHWIWVAPWGWTWVDAAAWGYAPSHYGRWVYVNSAWCWAPGNPTLPVVYAPALVAWIGGTPVAWVALAYKEAFQPSYRASSNYLRRLNGDALSAATPGKDRHFANQAVPGAITAAAPTVFASGQALGQNLARLDARSAVALPASFAAPPPPAQAAAHALSAMRAAQLRSAGGFARTLVARSTAPAGNHNAAAAGAVAAANLIPAQAIALHARREPGAVPSAPVQRRSSASAAATSTGAAAPRSTAEAQVEHEGNAMPAENRSRARSPDPVPKSNTAPKDPQKAKPELPAH
jgi:hypothetical protein